MIELNILEKLREGYIPDNGEIYNSFAVANAKLEVYKNVVCSISGGSDSDIMMDILCRINKDRVTFVFFDTGLEYEATREHLKELEKKYKVEIKKIKAKVPIPITCKKIGQPFLSKQVSENMNRLQKHNFKWEDEDFEVLLNRYCKKATGELEDYLYEELRKKNEINGYKPNFKKYSYTRYGWFSGCVAALMWWCNEYESGENCESKFNINYNKGLKEFIIENNPDFPISKECCKNAKKEPVNEFINNNNFDLNCYGVRKAEGGTRSTGYKNCFSDNSEKDKVDEYRPIYWYKALTKRIYENHFNITHSKCYTQYGLKRTGCAGCPYNKDFEEELKVMEKYEPKLFKAVNNIFKESYKYTRAYNEYKKKFFKNSSDVLEGQLCMF